jgi:hypothetical protein
MFGFDLPCGEIRDIEMYHIKRVRYNALEEQKTFLQQAIYETENKYQFLGDAI